MMSKEKQQIVKELHRQARKHFPRRRIVLKGLHDLWQADLAQMDQYAKSNKNFKFILVVLNCFSKYMWARPLKSKSASEVTKAFNDILKNQKPPKFIQTDQGKEFFNNQFQNLMKKYDITHYNTYSVMKAAIVERAIRTLKEKLFRYFSLSGSYTWVDVLQDTVDDYNTTWHRTIRMQPNNVNETNEDSLLRTVYSHLKIAGRGKFKVNDIVRISKNKHVFSKGYLPNWTTELFKIKKIQITNPITYLLEDMENNPIEGAFYEPELQKAKYTDVYLVEKVLRRKGNKVFVRWLGFPSSHDSWISSSNKL